MYFKVTCMFLLSFLIFSSMFITLTVSSPQEWLHSKTIQKLLSLKVHQQIKTWSCFLPPIWDIFD